MGSSAAIGAALWVGVVAPQRLEESRVQPQAGNRHETVVKIPISRRDQLSALAEGLFVGAGRSRELLARQLGASDQLLVMSPMELVDLDSPGQGGTTLQRFSP